jgi:hypothetical protein
MAPGSLTSVLPSLPVKGGELRAVEGFLEIPYWVMPVPGVEALTVWQRFREHVDRTGFWPVIVGEYGGPACGGSDAVIERLVEGAQAMRDLSDDTLRFLGSSRTPAGILDLAGDCPFERWAERQRDPEFQASEHLRKANYFDGIEGAAPLARLHRQWARSWQESAGWRFVPEDYAVPPQENRNPPQHEIHCVRCYDSDRRRSVIADSVTILFVPTRFSWQVPAFLFYSTREQERPPPVHVAALQWLCDRFGAQLVGLEDRVLEVIPQARPSNAVDALQAAALIAAYADCPVTSENERASIPELAVYLMQSEYWSFCWP